MERALLRVSSAPFLVCRFCADSTRTGPWGPIVDGHFTTCFLQLFLFCPVYIVFTVGASVRMFSFYSQPPKTGSRPFTRTQITKLGLATLLALYNLVLFAVHLGLNYGADFQWLTYPVACLVWSFSVVLLMAEFRHHAGHNWVLWLLWGGCFFLASFQLWTEIEEEAREPRADFAAFVVHYVLYVLVALLGCFFPEIPPSDYRQIPSLRARDDMTDRSQFEDGGEMDEDETRVPPSRASGMAEGRGFPWFMSEGSSLRRLVVLFAPYKWLLIVGLICALIAAPVEVIQFIYMGKIVDDVALQGGISSLKTYIALLLLLYLAEGVATALQVAYLPTCVGGWVLHRSLLSPPTDSCTALHGHALLSSGADGALCDGRRADGRAASEGRVPGASPAGAGMHRRRKQRNAHPRERSIVRACRRLHDGDQSCTG